MKLILPIAIVLLATSCSVSSRIKSADSQEISRTNILQTPTLADINVSTVKITGNYSGVHNTKAPVASIDFAKNMAMADAIDKAKCDFIVHPLFDIQINSNAIQVAVMGYPATYKSFKTVTAADSGLLFTINRFNIVSGQGANINSSAKSDNGGMSNKAGKKAGGILASLLIVGLLVGVLASL